MKILTKEEEQEHYNATLKGGLTGGGLGVLIGGTAVVLSHKRFPTFRSLTLPLKTFLVTSAGTFSAIVQADRASRNYENARDPQRQYRDNASTELELARGNESTFQRLKDWGRENRYPIVTASWVASMGIAFGIVSRNKYLTGAQKLVQARVYAQGLTLAVLIASAAFEVGDASKGKGRWETVKYLDPNDPEHKKIIEKRIHHESYQGEDLWRGKIDMVEAEERKIAAREDAAKSEASEAPKKHDAPKKDESPKKDAGAKKDAAPKREIQTHPNEKEAKNKIAREHKSAGKVDHKEAEEKERKHAEKQSEKEDAARKSAGTGPKIADKGA
ncbi:Respiratory supercomplex factor 2-like protein [Lachnellula suecica]|uniref:Respiratory supercomplex factor 2-like protein n=1 Tax=Lachnellula suecica TaxID=602035 RepID=A0A8T9C859_9HELO|nr:Respiratory supercomplex factor 2-like protein [Lachnellula suecica]